MLTLDRRMLLRAGSAAVGAAALAPTAPALARAPQAGKQAQPSFYRFKLGTIEITVVTDRTPAFPAATLCGDRPEDATRPPPPPSPPPSPTPPPPHPTLPTPADHPQLNHHDSCVP